LGTEQFGFPQNKGMKSTAEGEEKDNRGEFGRNKKNFKVRERWGGCGGGGKKGSGTFEKTAFNFRVLSGKHYRERITAGVGGIIEMEKRRKCLFVQAGRHRSNENASAINET